MGPARIAERKPRTAGLSALGLLVAVLVVVVLPTSSRAGDPDPNAICQDCHGVPGLEFRDDVTGELIVYSIDPDTYRGSVHGAVECLACHDDGYAAQLPHHGPPSLPRFLCVDCHEALGDLPHLDLPTRRTQLLDSAHGDEGRRRIDCHDCHDPHAFALVRDEADPFLRIERSNAICLFCHGSSESRLFGYEALNDAAETHGHFPNELRHFARVKCVLCHTSAADGVSHDVRAATDSLRDCAECHVREDPLYAEAYRSEEEAGGEFDHVYVIGSTRSAALDRTSQGGFVLLLLAVVVHSVRRRFATGRWQRTRWLPLEGPRAIMRWHGLQIVLVLGLLGSGLSMHYGDSGLAPLPFRLAVRTHNVFGVVNIALWLTFLAVNRRTGNDRNYVARLGSLFRELVPWVVYYGGGIFQGEPTPAPVDPGERFNPLQKLAYVLVMYVLSPLAVLSGSVLLYPLVAPEHALGHPGLWPVAMAHLAAGYAITLFLVVHLYMASSREEDASVGR